MASPGVLVAAFQEDVASPGVVVTVFRLADREYVMALAEVVLVVIFRAVFLGSGDWKESSLSHSSGSGTNSSDEEPAKGSSSSSDKTS